MVNVSQTFTEIAEKVMTQSLTWGSVPGITTESSKFGRLFSLTSGL